jgi:hypothetical protein
MARLLTRASLDYVSWDMGPRNEGDTFDVFTVAMLVRPTAVSANYNMLSVNTSSVTDRGTWYINAAKFAYYNNSSGVSVDSGGAGNDYVDINMWNLLIMTKTAGAAPRSHIYRWDPAAPSPMTHLTLGSIAALTAAGAGGQWYFGTYQNIGGDYFDGGLAACGYWKRAMSDSECVNLERGRWAETEPDFHVEFPSGKDRPGLFARDLSRNRVKQTAEVGTSRAQYADPPGFAFSVMNRRR